MVHIFRLQWKYYALNNINTISEKEYNILSKIQGNVFLNLHKVVVIHKILFFPVLSEKIIFYVLFWTETLRVFSFKKEMFPNEFWKI